MFDPLLSATSHCDLKLPSTAYIHSSLYTRGADLQDYPQSSRCLSAIHLDHRQGLRSFSPPLHAPLLAPRSPLAKEDHALGLEYLTLIWVSIFILQLFGVLVCLTQSIIVSHAAMTRGATLATICRPLLRGQTS